MARRRDITDEQYRELAEELFRSHRGRESWFDTGKRFGIKHPYVRDTVYLTQILIHRMPLDDWDDMNNGVIAGNEEVTHSHAAASASTGGLLRSNPKRRRVRMFR